MLKDDESVYKALTPAIDLTIHNGSMCFISEVIVHPGDCGPANVEIYVSSSHEKWSLVKTYECSKSGPQRMLLPGEQVHKYLRVRCLNNIRGGNLVNVRYVQVKGLLRG